MTHEAQIRIKDVDAVEMTLDYLFDQEVKLQDVITAANNAGFKPRISTWRDYDRHETVFHFRLEGDGDEKKLPAGIFSVKNF